MESMTNQLNRLYPFGVIEFTNGHLAINKQNTILLKPSKVITELYNATKTNHNLLNDIAFKRKVIEFAISKFNSDYNTWLNRQTARNTLINATNLEFLLDTANYIRTGDRAMHIRSWDALLNYNPEFSTTVLDDNYKTLSNDSEYKYIQDWLSHKGGLNDMLTTLYYIYGREN